MKSKKIETLTPRQEQELVTFRNEWLAIGLSTDRVDMEKASIAISNMYRLIDKPAPYFWFCDSPLQAIGLINIINLWDELGANLEVTLRDNLWDELGANLEVTLRDNLGANLRANLRAKLEVTLRAKLEVTLRAKLEVNLGANLGDNLEYIRTYLWGQMDAYWVAYYLFPYEKIRPIYNDKDMEKLLLWADLARSCSWWYSYENICFVCDRPEVIKKDDEGRLHCENGPALSFIDGYSVYTWHGTNIPGEWISNPDSLTAEKAITWNNIEQRRCACEILGWAKILDHLNAVTINEHPDKEIGKLLEVDLPDSGRERFLLVRCGTGRDFAIPVPPEMETAHQANAWTYGLTADQYQPEVRT
jgi:hypothetical protein